MTAASGVYEEINLGPGSFGFQLSKVISIRERDIELMMEAAVSGLTTDLAYGDFLDKMGIDKGIPRKGKQKAGGFVRITLDAPGATDTVVDLKGTYYTNNEGKKFYRGTTGLSQKIYSYIPIVRSVRTFDGLPAPFVYITSTGYVNSTNLGSGTSYTPVFNSTTQLINWDGIAGAPATGATYYVGISGVSVIVKDDIAAETAGTGYNIGANTVNNWANNATLPSDATVNNSADITGGAELEDVESHRSRIHKAETATFSRGGIRDIIEGINGVRAAHVYQDSGRDRISVDGSWTTEATGFTNGIKITGNWSGAAGTNDFVSGTQFNQRYKPDNAMGINKVIFKGRRIGFPPNLIVGFRVPSSDSFESSGIFQTYDVTPPASSWQDIEVSLKYLNLEDTETYSFDLWCAQKSGASGSAFWDANYWQIATGLAQSGNLGNSDDYTGLLFVGETVSGLGANTIFKTHFGANAVNVDVALKDGYSYNEIETIISGHIDASGVIGINYSISQATPISIYYSVTAYLEDFATVSATQDRVDVVVENYVEGLQPGNNVVYSQVYRNIANDSKIWRLDDLEVWESGSAHSSGQDIHISEGEVAIFGGSTFNQG